MFSTMFIPATLKITEMWLEWKFRFSRVLALHAYKINSFVDSYSAKIFISIIFSLFNIRDNKYRNLK